MNVNNQNFFNQLITFSGDDPDAFRVQDLHYHMPERLRGEYKHNEYKRALKEKAWMDKEAFPSDSPHWEPTKLDRRINGLYLKLRKHKDQFEWHNYRGIKTGDTPNNFRTRYPF